MHIPGLNPDIYSFMNFAFTVFFITLGFLFLMQCQCTDFVNEEDEFFDAEGNFDGHRGSLNHSDRDRDSDTNTTDRDYYPIGPIPSAPPIRDYYPIRPIPSAPPVRNLCLVCRGWSTKNCSRCKVARYCSKSCQIKHWREGHMLECEERESPANVDSASTVSSDGSGTSRMISNCDCSKTCQVKDWKDGHMLECKEYKPPNSLDSVPDVTSERRNSGQMDIPSSGPSSNRDDIPSSSSASPHICFVCSNLADTRCSSCKIARYCSEACQRRHWKEGHKLECKQYRSPANVDSVPAVTRERRDSGHLGISSHRIRDQMPSTSSSLHICFVCGHWAEARCSRCKVTRYCSEACQIKHWNQGHNLVCKEYTSPGNIGSAHAGSSEGRSSPHRLDGKLADTVQSPKKTSSKELPSVEQCRICFSTLHTSEPSCPLMSCDICNNKFHSTCLLKWFSTSKKSHCPLCRNLFSNRKVQP